jgi:hypothetical protein
MRLYSWRLTLKMCIELAHIFEMFFVRAHILKAEPIILKKLVQSFIYIETGDVIKNTELIFSIKVITDMSIFQNIENEFNEFIQKNSNNPFLLSVFIKNGAKLCCKRGKRSPLLLIVYHRDKIVGFVPLQIWSRFGLRRAKFLFEPDFLPDFVTSGDSETIALLIFDVLINVLKCKYITLAMSADSVILLPIEKASNNLHLNYTDQNNLMGHRLIYVNSSWIDFIKSKKHKFRAELKRVEKKIKLLGNCLVKCVGSFEDDPEVFNKIRTINVLSWKEADLETKHITEDPYMVMILSAIQENLNSTQASFRWITYFLELEGKAIAYVLVLQLNDRAYIKRTSFIESYRTFSPGIYLLNYVLKELFEHCDVKIIDFCSDHSYIQTWADTCIPRTLVVVSKGVMPLYVEKLARIAGQLKVSPKSFLYKGN